MKTHPTNQKIPTEIPTRRNLTLSRLVEHCVKFCPGAPGATAALKASGRDTPASALAVYLACRANANQLKIRGQWAYLYLAVGSAGKSVDFRLSPRRNVASAKAFFRKAIRSQGRPCETITLDGYAASYRAVRELQQQSRLGDLMKLRSSKYLNNLIEQNHRNVKSRLGAMLGLKSFDSAAIKVRGVELIHRIRKGQFDLRALAAQGETPSDIWAAVLAA